MFLIKVTAEQKSQLVEALDVVNKQQGLSCLPLLLPLLTAIQSAEEVQDAVKQPDLKVIGKEAAQKD